MSPGHRAQERCRHDNHHSTRPVHRDLHRSLPSQRSPSRRGRRGRTRGQRHPHHVHGHDHRDAGDRRRRRPPLPPADRAGPGPPRPSGSARSCRSPEPDGAGGDRRPLPATVTSPSWAPGLAASAVAAGGGARVLLAVIAVTGALLWAALPLRPRLRGTFSVDPVLTPLALLLGAVLMPYAVDQLALQNAATTGYHSQNPHLFDMAWMVTTITALALLGAVVREARGLFGWVAGTCTVIGAAGLATGESTVWSAAVLALGAVVLPRTAPRAVPEPALNRPPDAYTAAHASARRRPAAAPAPRGRRRPPRRRRRHP